MSDSLERERISIVLAGHVDHGKSTIVGRLLADSGALPDGKLAQVKAYCERNAKPFEYAFLVDALKNEQTQGVTIDAARVFFRVAGREHTLIDAPGHVEFIRNMVTGAARADAAWLVIDALEGIQENSRRHAALLALLGVRQLVVLVNKMDLVSYSRDVFLKIEKELQEFLAHWGLKAERFVPLSGLLGENVTAHPSTMKWYSGPTVLDCLTLFRRSGGSAEDRFRMWVQDVYKFTNEGDTRRIIAGTVESGTLKPRDQVIFLPSGRKSSVKSIERFSAAERGVAEVGEAIGFTLTDQLYIGRGELATKVDEARPGVSSRFRSSLFWLGREPMEIGREYSLRIGTARMPCRLEAIHSVQDGATLEVKNPDTICRHEIADCTIQTAKPIAFDLIDEIPATGRFVIVDQYEIRGGGIVRQGLEDQQTEVREKVLLRDYRWERSAITAEERAARFRQKPSVVIITGGKDTGKKPLARALESELYEEGHLPFFLGIGNVLYGVDADIRGQEHQRREHIRRLAEVGHIMLNSGFILIVTAIDLQEDELALMEATLEATDIITIWRGGSKSTLSADLDLTSVGEDSVALTRVLELLHDKGITLR